MRKVRERFRGTFTATRIWLEICGAIGLVVWFGAEHLPASIFLSTALALVATWWCIWKLTRTYSSSASVRFAAMQGKRNSKTHVSAVRRNAGSVIWSVAGTDMPADSSIASPLIRKRFVRFDPDSGAEIYKWEPVQ